ncbi:hypothetical protein SAMN05444008_102308 [Cnuella takakiae]|uniref:DUF5683 domain-containing protein n=1 Tax=Cnuella takakiae TaxID=1302690 RepID=A0A1M4VLT8_9BACT|nr:DUF5683 domain-containing protein [Cnuella takakiae]OLY92561.1 hypothetical protein BUE76_12175 [Cnuella takakiae]SHE69855.1 hypothetical protein SAMN05444008_102308 [Cnuella takakiae]
MKIDNRRNISYLLAVLLFCSTALLCGAQQRDTLSSSRDTLNARKDTTPIKVDSLDAAATPVRESKVDSVIRLHSPKKAAIRSAIIPGWGQIYNRKYWKLPLVYGALGTTAGIFKWNLDWYRRTRFAYAVTVNQDTASFGQVHPELQYFVERNQANSLKNARDGYRRNLDYSALFFLLFWGLNVVDATVDAHLKAFDVSPDLSLKIKAGYSELARTNGVGLVLTFK